MIPVFEKQDPEDKTEYPEYGAPKIAGNVRDDDADILDDILQSQPEPQLPHPDAPGEVKPPPPKAPTQLRTGTVFVADSNPVPTKLLNFDPNRCDLTVAISAFTSVTAPATITALGVPVTGAAAFTIITTIPAASLPEGWYEVKVIAEMYGTTAAADINNMRLVKDSTVVNVIEINPGTAGARVEQTYKVYCDGTNQLRVGTIGAATGTATYNASIFATPITDTSDTATFSPVYLASDPASLIAPSASMLIDAASDGPTVIHLPEHIGELWALLPPGSIIPTVAISWMATTR